MGEIVLRPYQQTFYDDLCTQIQTTKRVVGVLATGGGKSVIIAKLAHELSGRTLILTHRAEILEQNASWFGDNCGVLSSKQNTIKYTSVL